MTSVFPNDPRISRDPIPARSTQSRVLEDSLAEGIALSLASATASNYLSDQYGSLHRVIYESVARLLSRLIVDSTDLIQDARYAEQRPEYLASRVLYLLFKAGEEPVFRGSEDFTYKINALIESLMQGSNKGGIEELFKKIIGANTESVLSEIGTHLVNVTLSAFGSTSLVEGHSHLAASPQKGLGRTSVPIGSVWGDDRHTHEIINGVVQAATDIYGVSHTHDLSLGITSDLIELQNEILKFWDKIRPAHVKMDNVSTRLEETVDAPSEEMNLSLGHSIQEDMRHTREGVYEDTILGYSNGSKILRVYRHSFTNPQRIYTRTSREETSGQRHRIISTSVEYPSDGEYESITFPRLQSVVNGGALTFEGPFETVSGRIPLPIVDGSAGEEDLQWNMVQDGEPVYLPDGSTYFIERLRAPDFYPNAKGLYDLGEIRLVAYRLNLDSKIARTGLISVSNLDKSYRVRTVRRERFEWECTNTDTVVPITPRGLPAVLKYIDNAPVIGSDFQVYINGEEPVDLLLAGETLVQDWRDVQVLNNPNLRGLYLYALDALGNRRSLLSVGDQLTLVYPTGTDHNTALLALNHPDFTLNAYRVSRQAETLDGRGMTGFRTPQPFPSHPRVLNRPQKVVPKIIDRREITTSLIGTSALNTTGVLGGVLRLNKYSVDTSVNPNKVYGPAIGTSVVRDGKLDIGDLGFFPERIISIKQGDTSYQGRVSKGFIVLTNPPSDGVSLEVTALSKRPFKDTGDWFSLDQRSEGQVAFVSDPLVPYPSVPTVDEIMANPQGRPLSDDGVDEPRRTSGRVYETSEGKNGEYVFFEDVWSELSLTGSPFDEVNPTLLERIPARDYIEVNPSDHRSTSLPWVQYRGHFICGGMNGMTLYDGSLLNGRATLTSDNKKDAGFVKFELFYELDPPQFNSVSDDITGLSDTVDTIVNFFVSSSDAVEGITDEVDTVLFDASEFGLFAAVKNNLYSPGDEELFIVYTYYDYFATDGTGIRSIFSSVPSATFYADSNGANALDLSANRRGFIKTLIGGGSGYVNTTPVSANISWHVKGGSTTDHLFEPNVSYKILTRTLYDDPPNTIPDVLVAFEDGALSSDTFTVMGATPSFSDLAPGSAGGGNWYYIHTLSVSSDGVVSFTQDTVAKAWAFSGPVEVYFYVRIDDGGAGVALPPSTILIQDTFGNTISPNIHVPGEVSDSGGTAVYAQSTFTNPNNYSQASWSLTANTNYRITLTRDSAVDFQIFTRAYSYTVGGSFWDFIYGPADVLDYRSFGIDKSGVSYYLQVLENGEVIITN